MPRLPKLPAFQGRTRLPLVAVVSSLLLAGSGCQLQPDVSARVATSDGKTIEVPLNTPEVPASDGVVTVTKLQFLPWIPADTGKGKQIIIACAVEFAPGAKPANIAVDDVTDDPVLRMFADPSPRFVKAGLWAGASIPFDPHDEHMKWVMNLDNNIRVYRFTIKLVDGTVHVVYKPVKMGSQVKNMMRFQLGVTA